MKQYWYVIKNGKIHQYFCSEDELLGKGLLYFPSLDAADSFFENAGTPNSWEPGEHIGTEF